MTTPTATIEGKRCLNTAPSLAVGLAHPLQGALQDEAQLALRSFARRRRPPLGRVQAGATQP